MTESQDPRQRLVTGMMATGIPAHMWDGLLGHILERRLTGHFLTCVLENDLFGAVTRADAQNRRALPAYIEFLMGYAPSPCWGSKAKVDAWLDGKGSV